MSLVLKGEGARRTLGKRKFKDVKLEVVAKRAKMTSIQKPLVGFPRSKLVNMRYVSFYTLTSTSGVMSVQTFRANSINDPDSSGVGHQALGHDQWSAFYQNYKVLSSKITVKFQANAATTTPPVAGVILQNIAVPASLDYTALIEQGNSSWRMAPQSVATAIQTLVRKFDCKKFFNLVNVKDEDDIGAAFSANPAKAAYFTLWLQGHDQATTIAADFTVVIDYVVSVNEPKELAQS